MNYVVCQFGSRQYIVTAGETVEIDKLSFSANRIDTEEKTFTTDKVLLAVEDGKVEVGKPYLKKTLTFEVLGTIKKPKIRVSTYKSKVNYRRVIGSRREVTKIKLIAEGKETLTLRDKGVKTA